jgi:hypothetical protein
MQRNPYPTKEKVIRKKLPIQRKQFRLERKALPPDTAAPPYEPIYHGVLEGFTYNFLKKMFWRVKGIYEFEDLIQDAYEIFLRCRNKYCMPESNPRVTEPKHFMSLYQTSLRNHIFNLSRSVSNERFYRVDEREDWDDIMEVLKKCVGDRGTEGDLRVMVNSAPPLVREVLDVVVNKKELLDKEWEKHKKKGGKAEMGNTYLCSVLGYNPLNVNLVKIVRNYFTKGD